MAYQVCPICKGEGKIFSNDSSLHKHICPVCKGQRVIDENTGKPPTNYVVEHSILNITPVTCFVDAYKQPLKLD